MNIETEKNMNIETEKNMNIETEKNMNIETEKKKLHVKALLQGCLLILMTSLIYVGNNYLVSWAGLAAPEVGLVRGAMQILVFGSLLWRSRGTDTNISQTKFSRLEFYTWLDQTLKKPKEEKKIGSRKFLTFMKPK